MTQPVGGRLLRCGVLNAMYERDDLPTDLTHHELRLRAIAAGLKEPIW
jgi:hypothetical protein